MNYVVRSGQSVSDVVMATYGDLSFSYKLIQENPTIQSIVDDLSQYPGLQVTYTPQPIPQPASLTVKNTGAAAEILAYTTHDGQTVYDVCLQVYQDLGMIYKLIQDNGLINISGQMKAGTQIFYKASSGKDSIFSNYLSKKKLHINTGGGATASLVFGEEDKTTIFISEDGTEEFIPEP